MGPDGREVLGAGRAQPVGDPRRRGVEGGHRRVLRVEQAQDVAVQPLALDRRQLRAVRLVVRGQLGDVGRPAGGVADRVEQDLDAVEPGLAVEARPELDDLGVDGRPGIADRLDVELPELAVAAGLRPVVAEHRPGQGRASPAAARSASRAGRRPGRCRPSAPDGAPTTPTPRSAARAGRAPSRRCR